MSAEEPWLDDPVSAPSRQAKAVNPDAPWESDPEPATWWKTLKALPGTILGGVEKGVGGLVQGVAESDPLTGMGYPIADVIAEKTGEKGTDVAKKLRKSRIEGDTAKAGAELADLGTETAKEVHPGQMSYWQNAMLSGASSAAQQLPAVAATVLTRSAAPAVASAAAMTGGQTYAENRQAGIEPERAAGHAAIDATAEGALEWLPAKFLADHQAKSTLGFVWGFLKREVPTEVATTAIQSANAKFSTRPDMTWKEYGQDLLDTIGATMVAGPLTAGAGHALNAAARPDAPLDIPKIRSLDLRTNDGVKSDLTASSPPVFPDQPTVMPDTAGQDQIQALIASIDADTLDDAKVEESRAVLRKHEELKNSPPKPSAEAAWGTLNMAPLGIEDIGDAELGASSKQAANAKNYPNPNQGDRLDRKFLFGPEGSVNLTPRQVDMQPATYTLGEPSLDRDADYLKAVHDSVEQWRQQYMPGATVVVSNEALFNNTALGWYYKLPNMHLIVPAVIRSPKAGLGSFNMNTQASAFYNLTHEFGHALVMEQFYQGTTDIGSLPAPQQAVMAEYSSLISRIQNNQMSAQEFIDTWFSPGKLGRKTFLADIGVAPTDNAMAVVKAVVNRAAEKQNRNQPEKVKALKARLTNDFLSLDEYLAEQTARHAYQQNWDKKSPLGQFFSNALQSLRNFFTGLKKDGSIAPGTAFSEWINGLSKSDRPVTQAERLTEAKQKGKKLKEAPAVKAVKKVKTKPKVETVEHNVASDTDEERTINARKLVTNLVRTKAIEIDSADYKEMLQLIKQKDWAEFTDLFQRYAVKSVKFELNDLPEEDRKAIAGIDVLRAGIPESELTPTIIAEAAGMWQKMQFKSPYFKAWFGDWENDNQGSSKIRRGAVISDPTSLDFTKEHDFGGEPLVVFHATRGNYYDSQGNTQRQPGFERFSQGDIGFHFGTVRAAHHRLNLPGAEDKGYTQEDIQRLSHNAYIMPVVLNIRNPLVVLEDLGNWREPYELISLLVRNKVMTISEGNDLLRTVPRVEGGRMYSDLAPIREAMVAKGFDGIAYKNAVEDSGSISYIALHPNQVKSILGSRTYSRSDNLHMELDLDAAQPASLGQRSMLDGLKNFVGDFPRLRKTMRSVQNAIYHVVELQQLSHLNPDIAELALMNEKNGEYNRYKSRLQAAADSVLTEWSALGKENFGKIQKFLGAEEESKGLWFDLKKSQVTRDGRPVTWYVYAPNATTAAKATEFGLDEETTTLALNIKNVLLGQLNEAEQAMLSLLGKRYANAGQDVLTAAFVPVKRQIHELRKLPFLPHGRFGNRVLIIEKQKTDGGWEIVWREHFEDAVEWEKAFTKAVSKKAADERIRKEQLTDQNYVLMTLPTDFVDMAASELGLSDEQLERLMDILQPVKRDKVLSAYDQQRLGVKGYSTDTMRSFANFTWHNSNLLAKLIYRADFNWAIRGVGVKLREAKYSDQLESLRQVDRLQHIKSYMEKARDYIMAPPNEAQALRAAVSIGYLGLNVKTALLNLYGMITTWSDLTTRMGQIEGNKLFAVASKDAFRSIKLTNLNERKAGDYLSPEKQQALDKALEEGVLSQSYAYHLAGMANAGNLKRLPAYQAVGKLGQAAVNTAMYVFRLTELSTRRASFLAEFEAARKKPDISFQEAYEQAVSATNKLQNDYSLGNRVPFMRGVKAGNENPLGKVFEPIVPLATVFMSFAQHMAFHAYGGYELGEHRMAKELGETPRTIWGGYTMKIWIVTLLLAGYEGLPGAENLIDLIEAAWRKWGGPKPIRQELRELVQAIELDPQLAARGFGHNMGGYDISRSVGFGRIFPGTDTLAHPRDSVSENVGELILDLAGPTGGFIKFGLEAILSKKGKAETFEKLPGGIGNIYTAYRWSQHGVRAPTGALVTHDLETGKLRDLTPEEILGKALGFNPTIVSQNREVRFNQYDRKVYWQTRRSILLEDYWHAILEKDREAIADTKKSIVEYNAGVPAEHKEMRLSGSDIARSIQSRQRIKRFDEEQTTSQRRFRPLYEDVKGSYDRP